LACGQVEVWHSPDPEDLGWDRFLESTSLGQFQQSSAWGQYKQTEGWYVCRIVLTMEDHIIGGFQILWKTTRMGRIGYVSKGPVLAEDDPELATFIVKLVQSQASRLRLRALIVQAPDFGDLIARFLPQAGFLGMLPGKIINASCMLDLTQTSGNLEAGFSSSTRRDSRLAAKAGVIVREGTAAEISIFHELMAATCARQGVSPNPPSAEATAALWNSMSQGGHARLTFAVYRDEIISGNLSILYGNRASFFKVGWNGRHPKSYPNNMLYFEALNWARANQYSTADWVGISRETALAILGGDKLSESKTSGVDMFKLRFGGQPVLLPSAVVWINNPILRQCYKMALPLLVAAKSAAKSWRPGKAGKSNPST